MANVKDRSAARRREQMRQQRLEKDSQNTQRQQSKMRKRRTVRRGINPWWYIGGVLVVLAVVVGIFIYVANQQGNAVKTGTTDSSVLKQVTSVNPTLLSQVGTADVKNNFQAVKQKQPILKGPTGKPEFLYYGAEFCPYCAAQRWGVVVALSRFGTFTKLPEITSTANDVDPNTATFSFYKSSYTSNYIDFVPLEVEDGQGQPLQKTTAEQQKLIDTYNAPPYTQSPGGFPFVDVGNQFVVAGPTFDPAILAGMSQKDIAASLSNTDTDVSKKIMATANYMTASICLITNNQPTNVCSDPTIQQIAQSMPKATANSSSSQLAISYSPFAVNVPSRRKA